MTRNISSPDSKKFWTIAFIEWIDSAGTTKHMWHDLENQIDRAGEGVDTLLCHTAGIVIHEDEHTITVTLSVTDSQCGNLITIPKCAIRKRETLTSIGRKDDL